MQPDPQSVATPAIISILQILTPLVGLSHLFHLFICFFRSPKLYSLFILIDRVATHSYLWGCFPDVVFQLSHLTQFPVISTPTHLCYLGSRCPPLQVSNYLLRFVLPTTPRHPHEMIYRSINPTIINTELQGIFSDPRL